MSLEQALLAILGVLVLTNVLLLVSIPDRIRGRRRASQVARAREREHHGLDTPVARPAANELSGTRAGLSGHGDHWDADARAAAAIEAFVAEVSVDAAGRVRPPAPSAVIPMTRGVSTEAKPAMAVTPLRAMGRPDADRREPRTTPPPEWRRGAHDPALGGASAGLADPATWDRTLHEEAVRVSRFGRPITVVMVELPHLDGLARRLGSDVAERVVTEAARLLLTQGRAADRIAWLGRGRFGVLLLETEEMRARSYVDRVRAAADGWLESAGLSIRLSLGWASPAEGRDVMAAAAVAQQRMRDGVRDASPRAAAATN